MPVTVIYGEAQLKRALQDAPSHLVVYTRKSCRHSDTLPSLLRDMDDDGVLDDTHVLLINSHALPTGHYEHVGIVQYPTVVYYVGTQETGRCTGRHECDSLLESLFTPFAHEAVA